MAEQLANNAASTLTAGIDNVVTSLTVANGTVFPATGTFRIIIDSEIITVGARSGNTLSSLGRGAETTTASSHSSGAAVTHVLTRQGLLNIAAEQPAARVFHTANQSIATATDTILAFNSERFDTDGIHDNATNNSRLTCKTAGIYLIGASIAWAFNATGFRLITLRLNGTTVISATVENACSTTVHNHETTAVYQLSVDDYVEVKVQQTSGGNLDVNSAANFSPEFYMARIA